MLHLLNEIVNAIKINCIDENESKRSTSEILDSVIELYLNFKRPEHRLDYEYPTKLVPSGYTSSKSVTGENANIKWTECCLLIEGLGLLSLIHI